MRRDRDAEFLIPHLLDEVHQQVLEARELEARVRAAEAAARELEAARMMLEQPRMSCGYSGDTWVEIDRSRARRAVERGER